MPLWGERALAGFSHSVLDVLLHLRQNVARGIRLAHCAWDR
jgi:hypothetical protein